MIKCRTSALVFLSEITILQKCDRNTFPWLDKQHLDFYLPEYNIAIECQGEQHFKPIKHFGGDEELKLVSIRDKRKRKLCNKHNIKIVYYTNYELDFPYEVITTRKCLLESILGGVK